MAGLGRYLLNAFCALVARYVDEAAIAAKESVYRYRVQANDELTQGAKILGLFFDSDIAGETPFSDVRTRAEELLSTDH